MIDQLSTLSGNGFDVAHATAVVDSLNIQLNEQAAKSGKAYLDLIGFSCSGLIQQLSPSAADKFTERQVVHGVRKEGAY